jgi:RNA polymerase sigma factor (sigma-70 family)
MSLARTQAATPVRVGVQEKPVLSATTSGEREFKDIYEAAYDRAIDLAESLVSHDTARDAVQDVAVELWDRWEELQPEQRTAWYFLRAVQSRALDERRRSKRFVALVDEELDEQFFVLPDVALFRDDMLAEDLMDVFVRSMPPARRLVWTLVREARCSYEEAAAMLGISPRTVGKQLQQARAYIEASLNRAGIRLSDTTIRGLLPPRSSETHQ